MSHTFLQPFLNLNPWSMLRSTSQMITLVTIIDSESETSIIVEDLMSVWKGQVPLLKAVSARPLDSHLLGAGTGTVIIVDCHRPVKYVYVWVSSPSALQSPD